MPGKGQQRHGGPPGQAKGRGRRRRNSDEGSEEGKEQISYAVYESAANTFFKNGDYAKAIDNYTKALDLQPGDVNCLISRSKCYLELQDLKKALGDSDAVLKEEKNHIKGLLQKAEVLYFQGDFEKSLVFYHRGNKLRPEIKEFRLGIQKTQEAINNSVGDEAGCKLHSGGDLSFFFDGQVQASNDQKHGKKKGGYNKPASRREERRENRRPKSCHQNSKTVKELLGELYADKVFLEDLLHDVEHSGAKTDTNDAIRDLSIDGLDYLTTRTAFWQQQKPMYSRKRDKQMREGATSRASSAGGKKDRTKWVLRKLEEIDEAQADGAHDRSLKMSQRVLKDVERWSEEELPNRPEVIANLHSCIGNAYLELGKYDLAIKHHNKDLEISEQKDLEDARSRAMDNLGRVHARRGHFDKAVRVWEDKLPLAKSALEKTWLYHEIGRCHLEQGQYDSAQDYGERSLAAAEEASDEVWQLNASVLIAQSQVKLGELQAALDSFEKSLEMAKLQNDKMAQNAIKQALDDVNSRIVKGIKDSDDQEEQQSRASSRASRKGSPKGGRKGSREHSPKGGQKGSRENSPKGGRKGSRDNSPKGGRKGSRDNSPKGGHKGSRENSPKGGRKGSPKGSRGNSPKGGRKGSRDNSPKGGHKGSRENSPKGGRKGSPKGSRGNSPKGGRKDSPKHSPKSSPRGSPTKEQSKVEKKVKYTITTQTGDKMFSGTDADVFITIYGKDGETSRVELRSEKNDFESGAKNTYEHQLTDVGQIEKIHIGHNGENPGAGWYLDRVDVEVKGRGEKTTFVCDRWLDKEEADGAIEIDLFPSEDDSQTKK